MYTARVYSDMGLRGLFSVHISSEKADKDLISGDVYTEACRGGRFFVHTSSVQRDTGHRQCTTEVMDANGVQGGRGVWKRAAQLIENQFVKQISLVKMHQG